MDLYDGPIRGGTRGGAAEFKWTDVGGDKDRENYLGHSINAPTGRWQKNQDVHWYSRDQNDAALARAEEIRRIKAAEADILAIKLGYKAAPKAGEFSSVPVTAIPLPDEPVLPEADVMTDAAQRLVREEKAKRKEEKRVSKDEKRARKEEKRERKERRRAEKDDRYASRHSRSRSPDGGRRRSRSRSPLPRSSRKERDDGMRRSHSPPRVRRDDRTPPYKRSGTSQDDRMQRERDRDRRRWEDNPRREQAGPVHRGRGS